MYRTLLSFKAVASDPNKVNGIFIFVHAHERIAANYTMFYVQKIHCYRQN